MTTPAPPALAAQTPQYARRKARALIGWLPVADGALWLAGRQMKATADPQHVLICEAARASVAARSAAIDQSGAFFDPDTSIAPYLDSLRTNPSTASLFVELGEPRLVDLRKICAAQPQIHVEDAKKRVEAIGPSDHLAIARVALPTPTQEAMPCGFDTAKNAWIFSSANPNLRVAGHFNTEVQPGYMGFGFIVALQKSYIQVAGVGGRYFLRDGYHRAFGFLASGITRVPAFVKDYASLEEVQLPHGMLPQAAFLGDRPPSLADYLDDNVAADTEVPILQKMIVVQALELNTLG